jgi:hypothetical protein
VGPPLVHASAVATAAIKELLPKVTAATQGADPAVLRELMTAHVQERPLIKHDMTERRRCSLVELAAQHGDHASAVDAVMERFIQARSTVDNHLWSDVIPMLQQLRANGIKIGARCLLN